MKLPDLALSRVLSVSDFTMQYGPCRTRVYQLLNQGLLEGRKCGRRTFITRESAEAWAASLPKYQPQKPTEVGGTA